MGMKVATTAVGITKATSSVTESRRRKRKSIRPVRRVPIIISRKTFQIDSDISSPSSNGIAMEKPGGRSGTMRSRSSRTAALAFTTLPSGTAVRLRMNESLPL